VLYSGRDARWKLADFGSAAQATSKHLHTTIEYRGTASYRAPELLNAGRFNNNVDVFALGCILYEMVTGRQLFAGDYSTVCSISLKQKKESFAGDGHEPFQIPRFLHWANGQRN
jgi:eukaryotic-like serine/threonine-protein kinase